MPEIEIRPAVSPDLPILSALSHIYETSYVWQVDRSLDEGQITIHFREIRLPRPVKVEYPYPVGILSKEWDQYPNILVALLGGVPVGYVRVKEQLLPSTAWITDVVVRPQQRRQGIAIGLVLAAQDWAAHRGLRRVIMEMQSKNFPAICLAKKLGFEFCGYHDHYYANHDIALFFTRFLR
jgi:ribosomal protein S18 acetylase RimI-like enzyme